MFEKIKKYFRKMLVTNEEWWQLNKYEEEYKQATKDLDHEGLLVGLSFKDNKGNWYEVHQKQFYKVEKRKEKAYKKYIEYKESLENKYDINI